MSPTQIKSRFYMFFMLLGFPLAFLYAFLMFHLKESYYCFGVQDCKLWGSFASKALFMLSSFGIFGVILSDSLSRKPVKFRISKLLGWFFGIVLILISSISFITYVKTTPEYLETRDPVLMLNGYPTLKLKWSEISSVGMNYQGRYSTNERYRYCYMFPYVVLQNKSMLTLNAAAGDYSLVYFLRDQKKLTEAFLYHECYR